MARRDLTKLMMKASPLSASTIRPSSVGSPHADATFECASLQEDWRAERLPQKLTSQSVVNELHRKTTKLDRTVAPGLCGRSHHNN